jgi:hypothetical protein
MAPSKGEYFRQARHGAIGIREFAQHTGGIPKGSGYRRWGLLPRSEKSVPLRVYPRNKQMRKSPHSYVENPLDSTWRNAYNNMVV